MGPRDTYQPPFLITTTALRLVEEIGEWLGRWSATSESALTPRLRRANRIRTVQASLAIEANTLSVEQVTALFEGKRVLGSPREIQEVRNAIAAYDRLEEWEPYSETALLSAHAVLMKGLVDSPGAYRTRGVGIFRGDRVQHVPPPAKQVPQLVSQLLAWLASTDVHPLIASCVFHYEFEFIHPFADGNGRMGRLWQTAILRGWRPVFSHVPVESIVRDSQADYYRALAKSDQASEATAFVEFMLGAILSALRVVGTDQVSDQVSDQVVALARALGHKELGAVALMSALGLAHRPTFRRNYLHPALKAGMIEMTRPEAPKSSVQRYRLTARGKGLLAR